MITSERKPVSLNKSSWIEQYTSRIALGITALGLGLRLVGLGARPFWFDEAISAVYARQDFETLFRLNAGDNHPPGYYLALKLWIGLFGTDDAIMRLFSVGPGVISIWLVWLIGRRLFPGSPLIGLTAAGLVALSPFQIYFSQEVRNYSFLELFALLAVFFWLRALESNRNWDWLGLGVAGTLGLLCNFTMAFYLAALGLYPLLRARRYWQQGILPRLLVTGGLTGLVSGLLLLPKLTSRLETIKGNFWIPSPDPLIVIRTFYTFLFGAIEADRFLPAFGLAVTILGIVGTQVISGLIGRADEGLKRTVWLLAVPMGLVIVVSLLFQPLYLDKALIACSPFYYMLIGWAIFRPDRKRSGGWLLAGAPTVLALLLALAALPDLYNGTINPLYIARYDVSRVNRYLNEQSQPGDIVVTATDISWLPLVYYNPGLAPAKYPLKEYPYPNIFPALVKQLGSESVSENEAGQRGSRLWVVFEVNTPESDLDKMIFEAKTPQRGVNAPASPDEARFDRNWLHSPDWQRDTLKWFDSHYLRIGGVTLGRLWLVLYNTRA
jgi:4-amino-4-deoxy-L-arabinose transferase-like glycosyltransferase